MYLCMYNHLLFYIILSSYYDFQRIESKEKQTKKENFTFETSN
jgi:hypothetical protein